MLDTVSDYVAQARVLLQDTVPEYRYPDDDLVQGLNLAMLEASRLRPDLFLDRDVPSYSSDNMDAQVVMDNQYRVPLLYYICGNAQLRDEENTQDARATVFLNKFVAQMLSIVS